MWEFLQEVLGIAADLMTILASSIGVYLFWKKREAISSAFRLLLTYSYRLSLSELKEKLERLNDYNAKDPDQKEHIINILHEVVGQLRGNRRLAEKFKELIENAEDLAGDKRRLTEPRKRAFVSELRERLRHLDLASHNERLGNE